MKWWRVTFTTNEPYSFICHIWALCSCTLQNLWKSYYRNTGSSLWWAASLLSSSVSGAKDVQLSEGVIRLLWFQLHDITNYWQTGRNSTQNKHEYKTEEILFVYACFLLNWDARLIWWTWIINQIIHHVKWYYFVFFETRHEQVV